MGGRAPGAPPPRSANAYVQNRFEIDLMDEMQKRTSCVVTPRKMFMNGDLVFKMINVFTT